VNDLDLEPTGLLSEQIEKFLARNAGGKAGIVSALWDPGRAAFLVVEYRDPAVIARKVDRGGQPPRSPADDDAIESCHTVLASRRRGRAFHPASDVNAAAGPPNTVTRVLSPIKTSGPLGLLN
jgi:hypothetical protein